MNFDFVTNATAKELEQFKSVCNQLLSRTYIVRTIYQPGKGRVDNPDYLFLLRHYEAVQEYLSLLDWDLRRDELNGYFYVLNTDEATIARKYNTQLAAACTEAELGARDQLAFLGIYARPELYELSGDCAICLKKGELRLSAAEPYGLALPSTLVSEIVDIELKNICCITFIENKTNYDEYLLAEKQPEELVVYHGGFLSPRKKKLFEKLAAAAGETMQIRFWADIDLGGFCMFENLQTVFPQFEPMRMEGRFVEQYHKNGLKRPEQYLKKLKEERNAGRHTLFVDAIDKILQYGVTIEQETFLE